MESFYPTNTLASDPMEEEEAEYEEEEEEELSDESLHLESEVASPPAPLRWAEEDEPMIQVDHPKLMEGVRSLDHREGHGTLFLLWGYARDAVTLQFDHLTPLSLSLPFPIPSQEKEWREACQEVYQQMESHTHTETGDQVIGWGFANHGDGILPPLPLIQAWQALLSECPREETAMPTAPYLLLILDVRQSLSQPALPCLELYDLRTMNSPTPLPPSLAYTFHDAH